MDKQEILEKLEEIFRDIFDDDALVLREDMTSEDIEDWDSLHQIGILSAAEDAFGIRLAISDTRRLQNIGALVSLIEERSRG